MDDEFALNSFLTQFSAITSKKILIHGGGKQATKIGEQLGIQTNYINGRRITDEKTIDLVTMVYAGLVNKRMVAGLQSKGCNAIGLTGADANIIPAVKRPVKAIDYGFVGDINEAIDGRKLDIFLTNSLVPVIAPLTHDGKGQLFNTNADTIASAIAAAFTGVYEVRLVYCFEKKGVLEDISDENSVIRVITKDVYRRLLMEGKLADGILPKIDNAFSAIGLGVRQVVIGDAGNLRENCSEQITGTLLI